ncbi:hypothetical protein FDJ70_07295 [Clostridium botulinum]|nr:hypothetical protein [Clostridium botulinum]
MKEQIMALVFKSIVTILTAILSIIIPYFIAKFKAYIEEKGKAVQYNRALGIARGMYFGLEDEFKDIEKSGDIKKEEMKNRLLKIFPTLTDVELDSINKDISHTINTGIKELNNPIVINN